MNKIAIFLVLFLVCHSSHGQWTNDFDVNTLVADSRGEDMQAIGTSTGKTFVVFWKTVPAPDNYELRVQLLDENGVQQFGPDGMLVSDAIPMSTFTVIWSITIDQDDNLYIGATGTQNTAAFAFKIDINGNHLWGTNGVQLGTGNVVKILPLSTGEAIVSWYPAPQALVQKLDASGNTLWANPVPVVSGANNTVAAELFEMSNGDFTMVFHHLTGGINSQLYAQRFNSNGVSQWANPTQLSNKATAFNRNYSKAQDDDVVYMGYFASIGNRFDSYLQRLNPDGSLPWGINGSDFDINETDYETETSIAFEPGSNYVWSICTYTDITQNQRGEYVQKFDKVTGARLFTDNAKQLYPLSNNPNVHAGSLQLINDQPFFLIKSGLDTGASPVTLHAVYLDENGDFAWPEQTRDIATFPANKSRIQYTKPVNGQSVAVFIEQKAGSPEPKIYAQNSVEELLSTTNFSVFKAYFKNPVEDIFILETTLELKNILIFDLKGRIIFKSNSTGANAIEINTTYWKRGLYLMSLETVSGQKQVHKLIK